MSTTLEDTRDDYQRAVRVTLAALLIAKRAETAPGVGRTPADRTWRRRNPERGIYRRPRSPFWWIRWTDARGRQQRESTRQTDREEARRLLREKLGALARGEPVAANTGRVTVAELLDDLENAYRIAGQVTEAIAPNVERLRGFFGRRRAVDVTTAEIRAYIAQYQRSEANPEGLANGTLNRDLSALRRAYTLARQDTPPKLTYRPHFPMLKEGSPRSGFFEREQFETVREHLPADLRPVVTFAYLTGWRVPSEVLTLTWAQVSFADGAIRLEPGTTKNDEPREFPMTAELRVLLEAQRVTTDAAQRRTSRIIPYVFHRTGRPIKDFRGVWKEACKTAGCPGRIPHDFRRTAVRNLVRAGIPERVAMQLSGHKTRAVFERYNIVSRGDLQTAVTLLDRQATPGRDLAHSVAHTVSSATMESREARA
jgi:integrase